MYSHHFRPILLEFAQPLDEFQNVKQLLSVISQALKAHRFAHDNARTLHRDVSPRNIMITSEGNGLLVDWDLSKDIERVHVESPSDRTGTWQFMAARLLLKPENRPIPDYTDDLESFWYTLLYITLRHCEHDYNLEKVVSTLNHMFHYMFEDKGRPAGGMAKRYELQTQTMVKEMGIRSPPLLRFLRNSAQIPASRYCNEQEAIEEITRLQSEYLGNDFQFYLMNGHTDRSSEII
ncbi:hypothetical protein M413DRAFT_30901 [Hebeloma cylindrosporum]|uniref:Protein kinase domain-containing protein n=1 Tax=Hebeloma cylindrosporum TaxID=76867 RepID=A0A0C3BL44_HEBCY|nr:hypothetical protein M413DRAFT_30901 [Hebeloma cylindrosporum h7]